MKGRLTIISPKGAASSYELAAPPSLSDLVAGIGGGHLEVVPGFVRFHGRKCVAFCDEDGKRKEMATNPVATNLWYGQMQGPFLYNDILVGPIVIVTGDKALLEAL